MDNALVILFLIPVIIEVHNHRFEIYTLVSEIHENVDLVLGIKNVFELEGVINSRDCRFELLNRSVPIYPEKEIILKPDEKKLVKVKAPFVDKILGLAIIKIIDGKTSSTLSIKLKFTCNKAILDIRNVGKDTMILSPKVMIGTELQKLLKPIYDLTRKGRPFHRGKEQQDSFLEIKHRLTKPLVLHMPNKTGRFHLYSDMSKFATGSALYQIQGGKPKLIAYASKRLPETARNYSITELELCGLAINIASFSHLLKRVDFDTIVDHLALTYIIKSKAEPATTRIKRLLELISSYSFNLYYMKGIDMILSDFLSRQRNDNSDPGEIIPISFNAYNILEENRNIVNLGTHKKNKEKFLIQMCSQAKTSGTTLPEVDRIRKKLDPNVRPEKQHALPKKEVTEKPHIGQGRAGLRRKPEAGCITQSSDVTGRILERS